MDLENMDQENSEMRSEDTSCSPTAMSRTSFTDLVGGGIETEENVYDLPEYKIKMEIVEEHICGDTAISEPEKLDRIQDFDRNIYEFDYKIKMENTEEAHTDVNITMSDQGNLDTSPGFDATQEKYIEKTVKHSHDKDILTCPHCSLTFQTEMTYKAHIFSKCGTKNLSEFICALCKETFTCKDSFEEHSRTHNKPTVKKINMEVFPCESCPQVFSVESELIQHIQAVHHCCGQCGGDFGSRESLESHQLEHRKDAPCPRKPKLDDMQPTAAEVTSAAGEQEAADSSTATIIDTGGDFEHDGDTDVIKKPKRNIKLNIAKKKSNMEGTNKKSIKKTAHMLKRSGTKSNDKITLAVKKQLKCIETRTVNATNDILTCDICDYTTSNVKHLISHLRAHATTKYLLYSCDLCSYLTVRSQSYKDHVRRHTGEKPFSCNVCEKNFIQKSALKSHLLTHTGEKPFSCHVCEKKFTQKTHLNGHILTHKAHEKPFSCHVCEKKIADITNLKRHILTHEKPFSCDVCKKKFTQSYNLTAHILTHTGRKPFSCNKCEKKFLRKTGLKRHQLTHK